jgi:hypothetical protein
LLAALKIILSLSSFLLHENIAINNYRPPKLLFDYSGLTWTT